jgi:hypothetical protein
LHKVKGESVLRFRGLFSDVISVGPGVGEEYSRRTSIGFANAFAGTNNIQGNVLEDVFNEI